MLSEKINPAASVGKKDLDEVYNKIEEIKSQIPKYTDLTHIGQIILSTTLNTADKVNTLYGGRWEAFGAGRVLVGAGSNGGLRFTAGSTGGEYVHTLTVNEMPSHMHSSRMHNTNGAGINYLNVKKEDPGMGLTTGYEGTTAAGGGGAHNNMQPYVVVYMWRRVA